MVYDVDKDLLIDLDNLHESCLEQSHLFRRYGKRHVKRIDARSRADELVKRVYNKLYSRVVVKEENSKLTQAAIKVLIENEKEYMSAVEKAGQVKLRADEGGIDKESFAHRKSMLRDLVNLEISGYTGEMKLSPDMKRMMTAKIESKMMRNMTKLKSKKTKT